MDLEIGYAGYRDLEYLESSEEPAVVPVLLDKVDRREVIVARAAGEPVGWLRFGYFWDVVPFMNMLAVEEVERRKGYGTGMIRFWEDRMLERGHDLVMTSTQADELAQHLYRRLGYRDCGSMLFPGQVPLEILLVKSLRSDRAESP